MANIVIKKRVNLDFLGDEYKDDYLVFKSIPVGEYKKLTANIPKENDGSQVDFIVDILKDNFLEGSFQNEVVTKENIEEFDAETALECFKKLTGQDTDPKVPKP